MKIFTKLYHKMILWAAHRHAPVYLAGVSLAEGSFFPLPPDIMLAPMVMAKPNTAWQYAWLTTLCSVMGGIIGYMIGYFAFGIIGHFIIDVLNLESAYATVVGWFDSFGFGMILLAGFTPIPYKLFTIAAGVSGMDLIPFIVGSIVGRSARFFVVTGLIKKFGGAFERNFLKFIDTIGWTLVAVLILGFCLLKFM